MVSGATQRPHLTMKGHRYKNSKMELNVPFGGGVKYEGKAPISTIGKGITMVLAAFIVGGGGMFVYKKFKKMIDTDQDIRKHKEKTNDVIKSDDAHTDNEIRVLIAKSEINMNERNQIFSHRKEVISTNNNGYVAIPKTTLRAWIDRFNSDYPMPDYSAIPLLNDILDCCPDDYKDAMMFHILTCLGAVCFSKVRAKYEDGKLHSPSLQTIIEGESGSGKGCFNNIYQLLFNRIIKRDRTLIGKEHEKHIIQTAGIDVSASKFIDILADNHEVHLLAVETEIRKVQEAFSKKGGLQFSYLRNAFDNDAVYKNNKSKSANGSFPVFFNCSFTGTPNSIAKLINKDEIEGGTARRFCFTAIPELESNSRTVEMPDEETLEDLRDKIELWQSTYSFHTENVAMVDDDVDRQQCETDIPCEEHIIDLEYVKKGLNDWVDKQFNRYYEDKIDVRRQHCRAISAIAFHCAIVLHMMASEPDSKHRRERRVIKDLTIYIANYCMERYIAKYGQVRDTEPIQNIEFSENSKRRLTSDEIAYWYPLRGTKDKNGNVIGYGTIAKNFGMNKDDVRNAFKRFEKGKL